MTTLTVCIPAYNAEGHIERAIRSCLLDEVEGGIEILVCDDGSTDSTASIVEGLAAELPCVRLIRNETNHGRPYTRNHLLREATGRFLTWLDADDEKYARMIALQLEMLAQVERKEGAAGLAGLLVYTNFHWHRPEMDEPKVIEPIEPEDPMESLLDSSFGGYLWLMMGLRETFVAAGPFDEHLPRLQDLGFFIRFAELGGRFRRVASEAPLCIYYKEDGGRDAGAVWRSWCYLWKHYRHHYMSYGQDNARRYRRHHYRVARRFARNNHDSVTYWRIAAWEVLFVVRGRFRRVLFDA